MTLLLPIDVRDFLLAVGWTLDQRLLDARGLFALTHPAHPGRQIVLPVEDVDDRDEAVQLALAKISGMMNISVPELTRRILRRNSDRISLRFFDGEISEALPFSFAAAAVTGAERLLRSAVARPPGAAVGGEETASTDAAASASKPKLVHPSRLSTAARHFADEIQFDQTSSGSFVLNLACPIHVDPQTGVAFGRNATRDLHRGLRTLVRAIEADTVGALIDEQRRAEQPILSVNFCQGLAELSDEKLANSLEIAFDWAVTLPEPDLARTVTIRRPYFARIAEVAQALAERKGPEKPQAFVGTVDGLFGTFGDDERRSGDVEVLVFQADSVPLRVVLDLPADAYRCAMDAHASPERFVAFHGLLRAGRQPCRVEAVTDFRLVTNPPA